MKREREKVKNSGKNKTQSAKKGGGGGGRKRKTAAEIVSIFSKEFPESAAPYHHHHQLVYKYNQHTKTRTNRVQKNNEAKYVLIFKGILSGRWFLHLMMNCCVQWQKKESKLPLKDGDDLLLLLLLPV